MRCRRSTCADAAALGLGLALACMPAPARAQACCTSSGAITPARLASHEDALVGLDFRAANVIGSFDADGDYHGAPRASELDFEQHLLGALRFVRRGQLALQVPIVETVRRAHGQSEAGGGLGDINLSGRYDFYLAGTSWFPGIALLLGVTLPTGTAPDAATHALATDATGMGMVQGTLGMALEQFYGPWLVDLSLLVARRAGRTVHGVDETLGTQYTALGAVSYAFLGGQSLALVLSYSAEENAVIDGAEAPDTARLLPLASLAGLWPISDHWRVQGSVALHPPIDHLGRNQSAQEALTCTVVWSQ